MSGLKMINTGCLVYLLITTIACSHAYHVKFQVPKLGKICIGEFFTENQNVSVRCDVYSQKF